LRDIAASLNPTHFIHVSRARVAPRLASWMGDHPVFRYPVFRERCPSRRRARRPPRRQGWVSTQPQGVCQAESSSAFSRGSAQAFEAWAAVGILAWRLRLLSLPWTPKALLPTLCPPTSLPPGGRCPSREGDSTDPWFGIKSILVESSFSQTGPEFGLLGGCFARGARGAPGSRRIRPRAIPDRGVRIRPARNDECAARDFVPAKWRRALELWRARARDS
jgi:hypothetical protein